MLALTRSDFESAVKDALRHYTQADLLAENALLHTRLLTRSRSTATTPQALRTLLADTAKNLFASERDQRLYRVLEFTYLNPAPKQEAVADRLGLSFSTYRRHLTTGVDRLTEWLWRQEQGTPQIETIVGHSSERAFIGGPVHHSDNIAPPIDVFRPAPGGDTAANEMSAVLPLPDKPSVAVLPFTNMIGEPDQEFFPDGIAEDVITALSHYPSLFVIARNSCFTYKGRAVDVKQVGRELGVRYVVEGGVRKAGKRLRVTAQLLEAETGKHVWAERYDRDLSDIFALQDEIAEAVTIAIAPAIAGAERHRAMRKPPESLDAWAAYQRGLWYVGKANPDDNARSQQLFQQAIDLDPTFAGGYTGLAWAQLQAGTVFITGSFAQTQTSAEALARRAVALDDADAEARSCFGQALRHRGDYEGALAEAERALTTTPNLASAHGVRGSALLFSGRLSDGLAAVRKAIRLDPRDPAQASRLNYMAIGLYFSREYEAAVEATKRVIRSYPEFPLPYRWLAAALAQTGRVEEARQALEQALAIAPTAFYLYVGQRVPWMRAEDHAHMLDGLRKAGWREKSARRS
jgi:adenylate cyclase